MEERIKIVARLCITQELKSLYYCKAANDELGDCAPERCILLLSHPLPSVSLYNILSPLVSSSFPLAFCRRNCIFSWFRIAVHRSKRTQACVRVSTRTHVAHRYELTQLSYRTFHVIGTGYAFKLFRGRILNTLRLNQNVLIRHRGFYLRN